MLRWTMGPVLPLAAGAGTIWETGAWTATGATGDGVVWLGSLEILEMSNPPLA